MKQKIVQTMAIVLIVLSSTCYSAPVLNKKSEKAEAKRSDLDETKQFNEQEKELESLVRNRNIDENNVKVEEHHHVTYQNINGKEEKVQESEKAVIDENNGEIVSDIKQEVTETKGPDGKPETHVETKIDIPSEGIHQTFSDDENNDLIKADRLPNVGVSAEDVEESNVTPQALAEYLWDTQDFGKFRVALEDIVASKIMTPEEAQGFYQDVLMEYDKLRRLNSLYPFQSEDEETFLSPLIGRPQYSNIVPGLPIDEIAVPIESVSQKRSEQLPLYTDEYGSLSDYDMDSQRDAYELNAAIQRQAAVDDMLRSLLEEWFTRAVEAGDRDAAKLVTDLAEYIAEQPEASQFDDDQVRQILAEVFAAMANGEGEEEESETSPLIDTEDLKQSVDDVPEKAIEKQAEENVSAKEENETESSGEDEVPSATKVEAKSS